MKLFILFSLFLIGCTIYQVNDITECTVWELNEDNEWKCIIKDVKFECRTLGYGHGQKAVCKTREECIKACDKLRRNK